MLSESDAKAIQKTVENRLRQDCAYHNQEVDLSRLLPAIAKAVAEAIQQYDRMRR